MSRQAIGLFKRAVAAERGRSFHEAHRLFSLAADAYRSEDFDKEAFCLFRAAICLEKSQTWRSHAALWEYLGDRLGEQVYPGQVFARQNAPGQSGIYRIVSTTDWKNPMTNYYRRDARSIRLHRRAWAYSWAVEESAKNFRFWLASQLYRRAAITGNTAVGAPVCRATRMRIGVSTTWRVTLAKDGGLLRMQLSSPLTTGSSRPCRFLGLPRNHECPILQIRTAPGKPKSNTVQWRMQHGWLRIGCDTERGAEATLQTRSVPRR